MAKIKMDHTRLDTPAYITRMRDINAAMTGNADFTALAAKVTAHGLKVDALEAKSAEYEASALATKALLTERDDARVDVETLTRGLASSAEGETQDPAKLQGGGWHTRGESASVGPMPAPQAVSVTSGDMEGEADMLWEPVEGRDTYLGEYSASATGPWTQFYVGKKSSATAPGLTPGSLYYFRIRAVGTQGPGPWSDIVQKRIA